MKASNCTQTISFKNHSFVLQDQRVQSESDLSLCPMNGMVPGAWEVSYECGEGVQSGGRTKVTEEVSSHRYYNVTTWGERTPMRRRHSRYHSQYSGQCPQAVKDAFEMS